MNEEKMKSFTSYMFHVMEELELEERCTFTGMHYVPLQVL